MSRRGENIYKRKDGRWEARYLKEYDEAGKAKYGYIYTKTYREAKVRLADAKVNKTADCKTSEKSCYNDVLDAWMQYTFMNVKQSTKARYTHMVEHYIRPVLGEIQADMLTTASIEKFVQSLLCQLSGKTVNDILVVIKATVKYGNLRGYCIPCKTDGLCVKCSKKEMRILSKDERHALTNWLMTDRDSSKFGVLLSLYTGIRIGELCALKWKHICFREGTLLIRGTMQRIQQRGVLGAKTKIIIDEPKSHNSSRDIPLPLFLLDYAKEFQAEPEAYLLTGKVDRFIEPRTMQNRFQRYLQQCGLSPVNFHVLRHTFATHCVELGFEIKSLSEILGHANVNITLNKYVHSSMHLKRDNMEKLCITS